MNAPTRTHRPDLTLRTPEDVLAKVPYLVGFHPRESLVVLAIRPDQEVHCTLRADLPPLDSGPYADLEADLEADGVATLAAHLADVISRQHATHALLVVYTSSPDRAAPVLRATHLALESVDVMVLDRLIADGQFWWSDVCADAGCCPTSGTPYDLEQHPVTARSVYAGEVALADEDALRRSIAPVAEASTPAMQDLIANVESEIGLGAPGDAADDTGTAGDDTRIAGERISAARRHVATLVETGAGVSVPLTDEQVARVCVLVADDRTMVAVAQLITPETARDHQALWTQVLRRSVPPHDAGPATLLAFAAWSGGDGALARCALERALASDADSRLACFVAELLSHGMAPW
ncbi:MAG: DUF4192 domain-containing protein [Actinopolymorphaceae bacterium]